jgi:hypothetical protein
VVDRVALSWVASGIRCKRGGRGSGSGHPSPVLTAVAQITSWAGLGLLTIFGRELVDVCVKFHAARGRRARLA